MSLRSLVKGGGREEADLPRGDDVEGLNACCFGGFDDENSYRIARLDRTNSGRASAYL